MNNDKNYSIVINLGIPAVLLLLGLGVVLAATYQSRTNVVLAAFPVRIKQPFTAVLPYADAILAENKALNAVTVYVPDPVKRAALAKQAFLIDPSGDGLCSPR